MKIEKGIKMLLVSSYPPRECGIATFTNDIVNALDVVFGDTLPVEVCALQTREQDFQYPEEVSYVLPVDSLVHYRLVAEKINERNDIGLVCIQHEFGLFRGEYGDHILSFILALNKPIVTVFHTVLPNPDEKRKKVVYALTDLSDKVVVLTKKSKEILTDYYNCPSSKCMIIPHGNHTVLWEQKKVLKNKYGFKDKVVLSTFGLISENKGIENVLCALPEIVAQHPEVIYLVIGKTHPEVIKREGEKYRNLLTATVKKLGLENNVIFVNEYLQLDQLLEF